MTMALAIGRSRCRTFAPRHEAAGVVACDPYRLANALVGGTQLCVESSPQAAVQCGLPCPRGDGGRPTVSLWPLSLAEALAPPGELGYIIKDVTGCYPSMPKM